ncbi:hypothetical protein KI387_020356, partial [Taxus chinensis]
MNKSLQSLASQGSSLFSESSLHSEYSLRSAGSLQSELSLASVPSCLGIPQPQLHSQSPHYRCVATLQGHSGHVYSTAMDECIQGSQRELACFVSGKHGNGDMKSIAIAGDKIYTAHKDHRIRVWWNGSNKDNKHSLVAVALPPLPLPLPQLYLA